MTPLSHFHHYALVLVTAHHQFIDVVEILVNVVEVWVPSY
jgi:hypothetical protein